MSIKYYKLSEFAKLTNSSIKDLKRWERLHLLIPIYKHNRRYYTKQHAIQLRRLHIYYPVLMTRKVNSPYKDLTGLQFTYLSVIKRVDDIIDNNGHRHIQYLCRCKCGNTIVAKSDFLQAGYTKSCGCLQYGDPKTKDYWSLYLQLSDDKLKQLLHIKKAPHPYHYSRISSNHKLIDLTGKKFGYWTVIKRGPTRYYKNVGQSVCWICKCKCGTVKVVPGRDLKSGASKSCGCMSQNYFLEDNVINYLQMHHISYKHSWFTRTLLGTGGKPLHFDFAIYKNTKLIAFIECQGIQHYHAISHFGGLQQLFIQQVHDDLKYKFAESHNIPIYYVPYTYIKPSDTYTLLDNLLKL